MISGCTGAPPAACHALPNMETSALSGQAALSEFNFAQVIVLPEKISQQLQCDHLPFCAATETQRSCDLRRATGRGKGTGRGAQQARATAETRDGFKGAEPSSAPPTTEERLNYKLLGVAGSSSVYP